MSYAEIVDHQAMVFDERRNALYRAALRQHLKAGARVMDLGAGIGILGFIALEEGAAEVVMVEPEPVIRAARKVAKALGVTDRVRFIEDTVENITEPLQVDAILSVFTGNFLLEEDLLPSLFRARDCFLAPGGRLFPDAARMLVAPVDARALHARMVTQWSTPAAGIDLSALRSLAENAIVETPREQHAPRALAAPSELAEFDFLTASTAACDSTVECEVTAEGECHGLCGWFDARLGGAWFSTGPAAEPTHWSPLFLPVAEPVALRVGQTVTITVHRPSYGDWTWSLAVDGRFQRQSTFNANLTTPADLVCRSPDYRPR
ncbi:MAG: methyltransferase domain-containing protein, partial [Pseudomonadales bacterium]|nr:methyltransferase domain-containing protein [Pseudomonadales bacterium]